MAGDSIWKHATRYGDHDSKNDVDPEQSTSFDFRPKIPIKFRHKFYYCFEMEYYDEKEIIDRIIKDIN